jgi:hypothetical protein
MKRQILFLLITCALFLVNCAKNSYEESMAMVKGKWSVVSVKNYKDTIENQNITISFIPCSSNPNKPCSGYYTWLGKRYDFTFNTFSRNQMNIDPFEPQDTLHIGLGLYEMSTLSDGNLELVSSGGAKVKLRPVI